MDVARLKSREMVAERARSELDRLRHIGEPLSPDELHAIADHIEWAISVLQSTTHIPPAE